ncbi:MAG: molybdate ABC transporter substrate-binding protein [Clostridia bacterium]|nr:molybdate ABC transporter substrate-binding protein [Clostridia bacterium]
MAKRICVYFTCIVFSYIFIGCGIGKTHVDQDKPQEIIVFAAASLTESFTELGAEFEGLENGRAKVVFNFAGSQVLKTSVENGVKADIFASANTRYINELKEKGYLNKYSIFAKNKLVLIKNSSSSYSVKKLGDLAADGMKIAVGDKSVPVGMYWEQVVEEALGNGEMDDEEKSRIESNIKTIELNVKDVVGKVVLNEVDVGIVYRTDITRALSGKIEYISLPVFERFSSDYPAAVLKDSESNTEALKFFNFLLSDRGKEILKKHNFITDD